MSVQLQIRTGHCSYLLASDKSDSGKHSLVYHQYNRIANSFQDINEHKQVLPNLNIIILTSLLIFLELFLIVILERNIQTSITLSEYTQI